MTEGTGKQNLKQVVEEWTPYFGIGYLEEELHVFIMFKGQNEVPWV